MIIICVPTVARCAQFVICCVLYPLVLLAIGQLRFPRKRKGA